MVVQRRAAQASALLDSTEARAVKTKIVKQVNQSLDGLLARVDSFA
jgi:hypothetical protein